MPDEKITRRLDALEAEEAQTGDVPREVINVYMQTVATILDQKTGERREEMIKVPQEDWVCINEFDARKCDGTPVHCKVWEPRPKSDHGVPDAGEVTL